MTHQSSSSRQSTSIRASNVDRFGSNRYLVNFWLFSTISCDRGGVGFKIRINISNSKKHHNPYICTIKLSQHIINDNNVEQPYTAATWPYLSTHRPDSVMTAINLIYVRYFKMRLWSYFVILYINMFFVLFVF